MRVRVATLGLWMLAITAPAPLAQYTVRGRFEFQDREFNLSGFTGQTPALPVRQADVEVIRGSQVLARGATDANGNYTVAVSDSTAGSIEVLCIADSMQTAGLRLQVRVLRADLQPGDFYALSSGPVAADGSTDVNAGTVRARMDQDIGKAFNIWDSALGGLDFVRSLEGGYPQALLLLTWAPDNPNAGSFYQPALNVVQIGRQDGYDDTVIAHEVGHWAQHHFSFVDSPGGTHFVGDDAQDIRLAWSEGWATFFGSASRLFLNRPRPDIYVDTDGGNSLNFSFEIESLIRGTPTLASTRGATNEVAVAAALWDILDGPATDDQTAAGDDDTLQRPFGDIWRVMKEFIRPGGVPGVTIEDFWDGWFAPQINLGFQSPMQDLFSRLNGIDYLRDEFETDDQVSTAAPLARAQPGPAVPGAVVVISELEFGLADAIELHNTGTDSVDLTGWILETYGDSSLVQRFVFPRIALGPGSFLRVHENEGTAGPFALFLGVNLPWSNSSSGAVALRNSRNEGVDFVVWGTSTVAPPPGTDWFGPPAPVPPGSFNLARNLRGTDTDRASDFSSQVDSLGTLNLENPPSLRTFYPAADLDVVQFNALAEMFYLLESAHLRNGADTVLTLVDRDGSTILATSDDTGTQRLSRIAWRAPAGGTYYLIVSRFSEVSNFAAYGSYALRITERERAFAVPEPIRRTVSRTAGRGDFLTLGDAIAAAASGDVIEILDSDSYTGDLFVRGKNLTLRAVPGRQPRLSGSGSTGSAVIHIQDTKRFEVEGLHILGGDPAIRINSSLGLIQNCIVSPAAPGASSGDGIQVSGIGSSAQINHTTVSGRGGLGVRGFYEARVSLVNSIVAGNQSGDVAGVSQANVTFSLIADGSFVPGNGNVQGSPRFVDAGAGNFRLRGDSPGIDVGNNLFAAVSGRDYFGNFRIIDGLGSGVPRADMGAAEFAPPAASTRVLYFAQVADGGGFVTAFVLMNPGDAAVDARLELTDSAGAPLVVALGDRTDSVFAWTLPPRGVVRAATRGQGTASRTGWARLLSTGPLGGTAIFQSVSGGRILSEAGVEASRPASDFLLFQDSRNLAESGLAIANPSASTAVVQLRLLNRDGIQVAASQISLGPGRHMARFVSELLPQARDFEGTLAVSAGTPLAAIALRFDNPGLTTFTTLPVLADNTAASTHFPQVADGGGFVTSFVLSNPGPTPAAALLELFASTGEALVMDLNNSSASRFALVVPPRGVLRLTSRGEAPMARTGWARLSSSLPLGALAVFQLRSGSVIASQATVEAAPALTGFAVFQDTRLSAETGIALANPGGSPATVQLSLRDAAGNEVGATSLLLAPGTHRAVFFSQLLPAAVQFEGTVILSATAPVAAVALRFDNPGLTAFTTLPVLVGEN